MTTRMQQLTELTEALPELPELLDIEFPQGGPVVTFDSEPGTTARGFAVGVHRDADVGMMRGFMAKENSVVNHRHGDNYEWIGVAKGALELIMDSPSEIVTLLEHEAYRVEPGRPHRLKAVTDVIWWSVSMPPALGYPTIELCPFAAGALLCRKL